MKQPTNQAAALIVRAQSIISDLTTQYAEIQTAMAQQQALIDSLMPVAEWDAAEATEPAPEVE